MAMHTIGAASSVGAAAGAGLTAVASAAAHDNTVILATSVVMALAAIGGFVVAAASYLRGRRDAGALERHEEHDDQRFGHLEDILLGQATEKYRKP